MLWRSLLSIDQLWHLIIRFLTTLPSIAINQLGHTTIRRVTPVLITLPIILHHISTPPKHIHQSSDHARRGAYSLFSFPLTLSLVIRKTIVLAADDLFEFFQHTIK